jgi:hypothetical protein
MPESKSQCLEVEQQDIDPGERTKEYDDTWLELVLFRWTKCSLVDTRASQLSLRRSSCRSSNVDA